MRRVEFLIKEIRRITENETVGTTDGIVDDEIIQHLNDAQEDILDEIHKTSSDILAKEYTFDSVNGQYEYDIPFDLYSRSHVITLEFTTGGDTFYTEIRKAVMKERESTPGFPGSYHIKRDKLIISPTPNVNGTFRMMYNPRLPTLDKLRGSLSGASIFNGYVEDITLEAFGSAWMGLDNSNNNIKDATSGILNVTAICTFDVQQNVITNRDLKLREYSPGSVTDTTIQFINSSGQEVNTTVTGNSFTFGAYSTNIPELPELCEKYLRAYAIWKVFKRDGCDDSKEQEKELMMMKSQIVQGIAHQDSDFFDIPVINNDWFM